MYSIIGTLQFNQWGIPFVGPDICGFIGTAEEDLCQRWAEVGAFYPFCRNHNAIGNRVQDPGSWSPEVADSSRRALEIRYTLIPYLYTLFYKHYTVGGTVARALWHNFPTDPNTFSIDQQFMWGSGLLITPVLTKDATTVSAYFPDARFYSYYNGEEISTRASSTILDAMDFINLHLAGGNILPTQEHARNTMISRNNSMGLIVALDDDGGAQGSLFYDDGDSLDPVTNGAYFYAEYEAVAGGSISGKVIQDSYPAMGEKRIQTVRLLGAESVTSVTLNGAPHSTFTNQPSGEVLITGLGIVANSEFIITYT
jgi:alpha-glucosidase (family GH31 glycosyl hydrolase)